MKICIVGVGAIGGYLGARLSAAADAEVSALARGASLVALSKHGWRLRQAGELIQSPARATEDASTLGPQDAVIISLKAPALSSVIPGIKPLIGPDTLVISAMNGVPWWFSKEIEACHGQVLQTVNPGGLISGAIPYEQTAGAVIHASATRAEPGLVIHKSGAGIILGEMDGGKSTRVERVCQVLAHAGFDVTHSDNIRVEVWYKLWGNMTMNPVSAITGATADRVLDDELVRQFCSRAMEEAASVGARIGCAIDQTPEGRHQVTARLGAFKTSMLQDVEANQPIELDALVGAVREIAQHLGIATPNIDALFGITRLMARTRGLYPSG